MSLEIFQYLKLPIIQKAYFIQQSNGLCVGDRVFGEKTGIMELNRESRTMLGNNQS